MSCTSSSNSSIVVHPMTHDPTSLWDIIKKSQKVLKIQPPLPKGPVGDNKVCYYLNRYFVSIGSI